MTVMWAGWERKSGFGEALLKVADEWMEPFRVMWDERLDRLQLYIRKLQSGQ